ncbi:MAG TPA: type II toxin-antitoxin system RelE/ParE family toxin [Humisphaera sp.]|nr:type II toxin-antitoxin system RelE/ParE family toxin [Humisphaera sp.]
MQLTFLYSRRFVREWDRHGLSDADLQALEDAIQKSPDTAPVIRGTGGLRKMRFAAPSQRTGKRGALRVGFAYFRIKAAIFVVAVFAKNEASNFTKAECTEIAAELKRAERNFR